MGNGNCKGNYNILTMVTLSIGIKLYSASGRIRYKYEMLQIDFNPEKHMPEQIILHWLRGYKAAKPTASIGTKRKVY